MAKIIEKIVFLLRVLVVFFINIYQKTLSPDHGWGRLFLPKAGCIFYPSCSEYTKQAIIKHDLAKGLWLGLRRLVKCRPGHKGGFDFV
ncbi:MAG: membrane protein insertion efficiency factor YidD [Patescibacteria group bacterium]